MWNFVYFFLKKITFNFLGIFNGVPDNLKKKKLRNKIIVFMFLDMLNNFCVCETNASYVKTKEQVSCLWRRAEQKY